MPIEYKFPIGGLSYEITEVEDPITQWKRSDQRCEFISINAAGRNMRNRSKTSSSFVNLFFTILDHRLPKKLRKDPPVVIVLCDKTTGIPFDVVIHGKKPTAEAYGVPPLRSKEVYEMVMEVERNYGGGGGVLHIHKIENLPVHKDLREEIEKFFK